MNFIFVKALKNRKHVRTQLTKVLHERRLIFKSTAGAPVFPDEDLFYGIIDMTGNDKIFRMFGKNYSAMNKFLESERMTQAVVFAYKQSPDMGTFIGEDMNFNYHILGSIAADYAVHHEVKLTLENIGVKIETAESKKDVFNLEVLLKDFLLNEQGKTNHLFSKGKMNFCLIATNKKSKKVERIYFGSNSSDMFWSRNNKFLVVGKSIDTHKADWGMERHVFYWERSKNDIVLSKVILPYYQSSFLSSPDLKVIKHSELQSVMEDWKRLTRVESSLVLPHTYRSLPRDGGEPRAMGFQPTGEVGGRYGYPTRGAEYYGKQRVDNREILVFDIKSRGDVLQPNSVSQILPDPAPQPVMIDIRHGKRRRKHKKFKEPSLKLGDGSELAMDECFGCGSKLVDCQNRCAFIGGEDEGCKSCGNKVCERSSDCLARVLINPEPLI